MKKCVNQWKYLYLLASALFCSDQSKARYNLMGNVIKIPLGHLQISKMICDWSTQKCSVIEQEKYFDLIGPYDSTGNIWMTWRLLCAIWFNLIAFPLYLVKLIVFNLVSSLKPISHGPWVGLWVGHIWVVQNQMLHLVRNQNRFKD